MSGAHGLTRPKGRAICRVAVACAVAREVVPVMPPGQGYRAVLGGKYSHLGLHRAYLNRFVVCWMGDKARLRIIETNPGYQRLSRRDYWTIG